MSRAALAAARRDAETRHTTMAHACYFGDEPAVSVCLKEAVRDAQALGQVTVSPRLQAALSSLKVAPLLFAPVPPLPSSTHALKASLSTSLGRARPLPSAASALNLTRRPLQPVKKTASARLLTDADDDGLRQEFFACVRHASEQEVVLDLELVHL